VDITQLEVQFIHKGLQMSECHITVLLCIAYVGIEEIVAHMEDLQDGR
jgi:hypothetical protein